jgi:hypothetical protein
VPGATVTPVGGGSSIPINSFPTLQPGTPISSPSFSPSPSPSPSPSSSFSPSRGPSPGPGPGPLPTPIVTPPIVTPQPVVISVAGLAKSTNGPPTVAGFIDQTANGRIPYSNATITYPPGSVPQNGTFTASIGGAGRVMLSPLTPGSTNRVTATSSTGATAAGTATMTPDGKFFYANLTATSPGTSGDRLFVFGGVPVTGMPAQGIKPGTGFYAPTPTKHFYAFAVQPEGALGSGSQPQTIPFLPSNYGGTMPNATVSPLYLATIDSNRSAISTPRQTPAAPRRTTCKRALPSTARARAKAPRSS